MTTCPTECETRCSARGISPPTIKQQKQLIGEHYGSTRLWPWCHSCRRKQHMRQPGSAICIQPLFYYQASLQKFESHFRGSVHGKTSNIGAQHNCSTSSHLSRRMRTPQKAGTLGKQDVSQEGLSGRGKRVHISRESLRYAEAMFATHSKAHTRRIFKVGKVSRHVSGGGGRGGEVQQLKLIGGRQPKVLLEP